MTGFKNPGERQRPRLSDHATHVRTIRLDLLISCRLKIVLLWMLNIQTDILSTKPFYN
jgi:hypothetical protein